MTKMDKPLKWFKNKTWLALLFLLGVYGAYQLVFINRFFPLTEGWFSEDSMYLLSGDVMYKDFAMYMPPLYPLIVTAINKIFNYSFLALRIYGLFERLLILALLFEMLKDIFGNKVSVIALLAGGIFYTANLADIFYSHYQTAFLFGVISLFFFYKAYRHGNENKKRLCYMALCGLGLGLTTFSKHTLGIVLFILFFGLAVAFFFLKKTEIKKSLPLLCLSYMLVLAIGVGILAGTGALTECIQQLFGTDSKGSITSVLFGMFRNDRVGYMNILPYVLLVIYLIISLHLFRDSEFMILKMILDIILTGLLLGYTIYKYIHYADPVYWICCIFALVFSICVILSKYFRRLKFLPVFSFVVLSAVSFSILLYINTVKIHDFSISILNSYSYVCFFVNLIVAVFLFGYLIKNRKNDIMKPMLLFILMGFSCSFLYVHGMSNAMEPHGTLLANSIMIGLVLYPLMNQTVAIKQWNVIKTGTTCFAMFLTVVTVMIGVMGQKIEAPYHWWGAGDSPRITDADTSLEDPNLKGFLVEKEFAEEMNEIYQLVNDLKQEGDQMYTYPNCNYFNVMSQLKSPTFAKVHFFDVCPDSYALSDLKIIQETKPEFIIYMNVSEDCYIAHEYLFRGGNPCGQRTLFAGLLELCQSDEYELFYVSGHISEDPIYFYHKKG